MASNLELRFAVEGDVATILQLIKELAEYERLAHSVEATEDVLRKTLFGPRPYAEALLAEVKGEPIGFALFFHNYSTFLASPGIYLEDLFVRPEFRGIGIGKRLMSAVASIAVKRGCSRFEWAVLDWNEPSKAFYEKLGAQPQCDWTVMRLSGEDLRNVALSGSSLVDSISGA
jgi:GNAT superfamily N-acetyltransferase